MVLVAALLVAGIGSAAVLDSYGIISGTASVDPAVTIASVDATNDEVVLQNDADVAIDGDADGLTVNVTERTSKDVAATIEAGTQETVTFSGTDITDGDTVYILIDGTKMDQEEVSTQ